MASAQELSKRPQAGLFLGNDRVFYDHQMTRRRSGVVNIQQTAVEYVNQYNTKLFVNALSTPSNFLSTPGATIDIPIRSSNFILQKIFVEFTVQCNNDKLLPTPYWFSDVSLLGNANSLTIQRWSDLGMHLDAVSHLTPTQYNRLAPAMNLVSPSTALNGTKRLYLPLFPFFTQGGGIYLPLLGNGELTVRMTSRGALYEVDANPPTLSACRLVMFCQTVSDATAQSYQAHVNNTIDFSMCYNQVFQKTMDIQGSTTLPAFELQSIAGLIPWMTLAVRPVAPTYAQVLDLTNDIIDSYQMQDEAGNSISQTQSVEVSKFLEDDFQGTIYDFNPALIPMVFSSSPVQVQFLGRNLGSHIFGGKDRLQLTTKAISGGSVQRVIEVIAKIFALVRIEKGVFSVYSS